MRHLLIVSLVLLLAAPAHAQHLGARLQWQPEIADIDPRLQQKVEIEILGRAAVPALHLLSNATGVSLTVAPENLDTVGERKLTLISKGLALKAILIQLPEALQECHWDIDTSGDEPIYLLHRNAGGDQTIEWLLQRDAARLAEQHRTERVNRMEEARRALEMSPGELADLEKTDPLLARSVQDPHSRDLLEILLTLPPEQDEQFRDTGGLEMNYAQAPDRLKAAVQRIADWWVGRLVEWATNHPDDPSVPEELRHWRDHLDHATLAFNDNRVDHGWGVWLSLDIPNEQGYPTIHDVALQPRYCNLDEGQLPYTRLLVATGVSDEETAFQMAIARDKQGFRADAAKHEERHQREWIEPTDPALLQTIVLGDAEFDDIAQLQASIADDTSIPIVSDFFTLRAPYLSEEIRQGIPLWRLLYLIGEDDFRNADVYLWQKRGDCLVFHRADWPHLAKVETPEWLIADCRTRIEDHGEFTLDDLAEIAVMLDSRNLPVSNFPRDIQIAGLHVGIGHSFPSLLLYASLSPEQREAIITPEGLPFSDLTAVQREQVIQRALHRPVPLSREQAYRATFHLVEATQEAHGRRFSITKLELRFPDATDETMVSFKRLPEESPAKAEAPGAGD